MVPTAHNRVSTLNPCQTANAIAIGSDTDLATYFLRHPPVSGGRSRLQAASSTRLQNELPGVESGTQVQKHWETVAVESSEPRGPVTVPCWN